MTLTIVEPFKMYRYLTKIRHLPFASLQKSKIHHEAVVDWNRVVLEAEKVVGYPTSFLNLRWLLNDEIANIAQHLKRLIGTEHPILNTARGILTNQLPAWGLIVLLVSKTIGLNRTVDTLERDSSSGILHSQRVLAEITEMIRMSNLIHKGLLNITSATTNEDNMHFGNKIALLSGDYLLSKTHKELTNLKNEDVTVLMSSALRDLTECEFLGVRDNQNKAIPSKPNALQADVQITDGCGSEPIHIENAMGHMESEWTLRNLLGGATLLGKSCTCAIKLAGFGEDMEKRGYQFGKHLALAWQASIDLLEFQARKCERFNLVGAPLMYHLADDPKSYETVEAGLNDITLIDYNSLREDVLSGRALQLTEALRKKHATLANDMLDTFGENDAKLALQNIIEAM